MLKQLIFYKQSLKKKAGTEVNRDSRKLVKHLEEE